MQGKILQLFPVERRKFWQSVQIEEAKLQEIRFRTEKPVILIIDGREHFLAAGGGLQKSPLGAYCANRYEIEELLNHICHYSLYAYEDELKQGFLTVEGGYRVGIAGQVVQDEDGSIRTIKNITCLNIRIAHQIKGAADELLPHIYQGGELKNILLISPPGCGKTTLLRDLIRQISDGNAYGEGRCVAVVDERSEIAGSYLGCPQNDVGIRTDIMDACPKALGMMLLLRSMSPKVIAIDELGGEEDLHALHTASFCGIRILATIHGNSLADVKERFFREGLSDRGVFDLFVTLGRENGRPVIKQIMGKGEADASYSRDNHDYVRMHGTGNVVPTAVYTAPAMPAYLTADSGTSHG